MISQVGPALYDDEDFNKLLGDRSGLLDDPAWIFVHVLPLLARAEFHVDLLLEAFGVDGADADSMVDGLMRADAWPMVRVPLADDLEAVVVHRNLPEDFGIDYFLTHPGWECALQLAADKGSYIGPGLCWPELVTLARGSAASMLALLPILGDSDLPGNAPDIVMDALLGVGVEGEEDIVGLATALLTGHFNWGHERWEWHEDALRGGIWVCAGRHSGRGAGFDNVLTVEQSARLRRQMAGSQHPE